MNIDEGGEYVIPVLTNHAVTTSQTCYSNTTTTKVSSTFGVYIAKLDILPPK